MHKVISEKTVFNDWFHIEEAEVKTAGAVVSRMRLNRSEASAMLVYNRESGYFILVSQFRYAISNKTSQHILESLAGKMDEGESPLQTAIRECREETGYEVQAEQVQHVASCFASPGYSSELLHLYYVEVENKDHLSPGGGLESEQEEITVVELSRDEFFKQLKNNQLQDAKTVLIGYWLLSQNKPL